MAGTRIRLAALAAACLLPLTACGGVHLGGGSSDTFTTMGYGTGDPLSLTRLQDTRKVLAPLHIQVNQGAFDSQQFLSAVAAGDPPDVVHMDRQLIGGFAAKGALVPLTDCIRSQHIDTSQYRGPAMAEGTLHSTVYSLPDSYDSRLMMLNGKTLDESGLTPADLDTSNWSRLRSAALKMNRTGGGKLTRLGFNPKLPEFFPLWVAANGGSMISADGRTAHLDDPKTVQALEYAVSVIKAEGGFAKMKSLNDSFDLFGSDNQFAKDQLGAFPMEDWYFNVLSEVSPKLDLVTEPFRDRRGNPLNYTSGFGFAIPKGSKHPKQACTFIKSMTSTKEWLRGAQATADQERKNHTPYLGSFTGNKTADKLIHDRIWKPTGNAAYDRAARELYQAQSAGFALPANPAGQEFTDAWNKAVNRVLSGDQSPAASLRQAQHEAQRALDLANEGQ